MRLHYPKREGSLYDSLTALRKQAGLPADVYADIDTQLDLEMPSGYEHLFTWFMDISAGGRPGGGFGPTYILHSEIEAWSRNSGMPLRPVEIDILRKMDRAYVAEATKCAEEDRPSGTGKTPEA